MARFYLSRFGFARLTTFGMATWLATTLAPAQTLHALTLADTKDPLLANACEQDIAVMSRQFRRMARATGYDLHEHVLTRERFSRRSVDSLLAMVRPAPADVVFLYYTGHGYNQPGRTDKFPLLLLEKDPARLSQNPELLALHEQLRAKGVRLCITLADCCNNLISNTRGMAGRLMPRGLVLTDDSLHVAYRNLLSARGDVLIASSQPPQQSCAHPDSGSFYTRAFDEALETASRFNRFVTWESLLRDAQMRLTQHSATRDKQSLYAIRLNVVAAGAPAATTSGSPVAGAPVADTSDHATTLVGVDFARVNQYLNRLADASVPAAERAALLGQLHAYFARQARIDIYVNDTRADVQPVEQFARRLYLNAGRIRRINLIERLSEAGPTTYRRAAVQEIW